MNPNFTGTWRANLQKSKLLGSVPRSIIITIQHSDSQLSAEMVITTPDSIEHRLIFKGTIEGEEGINAILGASWHSRLYWVGMEMLIESRVTQGTRELHFRDYWSLSDDAGTLTMEHRGDDLAGQISILERISDRAD
jgi:hypothetical protein